HAPLPLSIVRPRPRPPPLFPYTTLFRSPSRSSGFWELFTGGDALFAPHPSPSPPASTSTGEINARSSTASKRSCSMPHSRSSTRSEEHTSELQSRFDLVCRLLLEKTKIR